MFKEKRLIYASLTAPTSVETKVADAGTAQKIAETPKVGQSLSPPAAPSTTTPKPAAPATPALPAKRDPAAATYKTLGDKAMAAGLSGKELQAGYDAFDRGNLNEKGITDWLNRVSSDTSKQTSPVKDDTATPFTGIKGTSSDVSIGDPGQSGAAPGDLTPPSYDQYTDAEKAVGDYDKAVKDLGLTYQASQDALIDAANNRYNSELTNLKSLEQMQQELTSQMNALVESSAGIQKQELKNAYDANQRAIDSQKKKVGEAYQGMQQEQSLLNKQREIKAETAMGMIYGYGSVAANKNIEDTIMKGERELLKIKQDAVNADTDLQNEVIKINDAYQLDVRKIEQWKSEEIQQNYTQLQNYLMKIQGDKSMAGVEKQQMITEAVNNYNEQIGQLNATSVQAKYDLALGIMERVQGMEISASQEKRAQESEKRTTIEFGDSQEAKEREKSLTSLDLMMSSYASEDWEALPPEVQAQMNEFAATLKMPDSFAQSAFETYRQAQMQEEPPEFKYYTDNFGNVTALTYDNATGGFVSVPLGGIDKAATESGQWATGKDEDGALVMYNKVSGEVRPSSAFTGGSGGTVIDALNVPDGSKGGQCGRFVNNYTGLGLGDKYSDKMAKMDPSITVGQPGDVFVMPYSWTGHTGFILETNEERQVYVIKDSNYGLDEKVQTHEVPFSKMTGFYRPGSVGGSGSNVTLDEKGKPKMGGTSASAAPDDDNPYGAAPSAPSSEPSGAPDSAAASPPDDDNPYGATTSNFNVKDYLVNKYNKK